MELESCSSCDSGSAFQPLTPLIPCLTCLPSCGLVSLFGTGISALGAGLMVWGLLVHVVLCACRGLGWVVVFHKCSKKLNTAQIALPIAGREVQGVTAHTPDRAARCEAWVWDQEDSSLLSYHAMCSNTSSFTAM